MQFNRMWLTSKQDGQRCAHMGLKLSLNFACVKQFSEFFFIQCGESRGFKGQSPRNGEIYLKWSHRFGLFFDCIGLCFLWKKNAEMFAFSEKCWYTLKESWEKNFNVKRKSMNDFEPLERVSRNQNLSKTQDLSQDTARQTAYVCIVLGLPISLCCCFEFGISQSHRTKWRKQQY